VAVETLPAVPVLPVGRPIARLAVLGDSIAVGVGDPLPAGGWRGFGPLLAAALGAPRALAYTNLSTIGARMAHVRHRQLSNAVAARPDIAVVVAGMNDTLRSDFDPAALSHDLDATVTALQASGAVVLTIRFHDHGRVFRLPVPLCRALHQRIEQLNRATDQVVARRSVLCLDLHLMSGTYDPAAWSVDRLHPSESGHRLLASGFADLLTGAGIAVPHAVDLTCAGGRQMSTAQHVAWLVCHGTPWLVQRGRDLLPHAAGLVLRDLFGRPAAVPSRCGR
jgi:lysophospholipase L1-like esterase